MAITLEFEEIYEYSLFKSGITVPIKLTFADNEVGFTAKIDTPPPETFAPSDTS